MKKSTLVAALLSATVMSQSAHAGWFDDFFKSADNDAQQAQQKTEQAAKDAQAQLEAAKAAVEKTQAQEQQAAAKVEATKTAATEQGSNLVNDVMSQLKLNENQAQGGIGSLLSIAQTALGDSKFKAIEDSIPGAQQLMQAAPAFDTKSGLGGLISQAAGSTDLGKGLQGSAMLYTAFEKLGISKDLAAPMINIVTQYLQTNGTNGAADLLKQGLSSLL